MHLHIYFVLCYISFTICLLRYRLHRLESLRNQDGPEVDLSVLQLADGLLDSLLVHGEDFSDGLDSVKGGELEHLPVHGSGGYQGTLNGDSLSDKGHVGDHKVALADRERVDARSHGHHGEQQRPLRLGGGGHEQSVELGGVLQVVGGLVLHSDEILGTEPHSLLLLAVGSREDDNSATHLGGELDGQMTKSTHSQDSNDLVGLGVLKSGEDGSTSTLKGGGVGIAHTLGDGVQEGFPPDGSLGEGSLVRVGHTVHGTLGTKDLLSLETLETVTTRVGLVSPSDTVALLEVLDIGSGLLDDSDSLVSENHVGLQLCVPTKLGQMVWSRHLICLLTHVVDISSTDTRGSDLEPDKVASKLVRLGGGRLDDLSGLGTLVYGDGRHV
jgi:hypothetical protein